MSAAVSISRPRLSLARRFSVTARLLLVTMMAACGGGGDDSTAPPPPPAPVAVASVELDRSSASLVPQSTVQLTATPKSAAGTALTGRTISWSSTSAPVATVNSSGLVTAVSAGTATIVATSEGQSASATVTVLDGAIIGAAGGTVIANGGQARLIIPAGALSTNTTITVTPLPTPPGPPGPIPGTAYELGPSGTTFAQPVALEFRYPVVSGKADSLQLLYGIRRLTNGVWTILPGSTVNLATRTVRSTTSSFSTYSVGLTANQIVPRISPANNVVIFWQDAQQFTVDVRDDLGDPVTGTVVEWSSPALSMSATGRAVALVPGLAGVSVRATKWYQCNPKPCQSDSYFYPSGSTDSLPWSGSSSIVVTVALRPVKTVTLSPSAPTLTAGQSQALTATLRAESGENLPMTYRTITWSTSNSAVATVTSTGAVTAVAPGAATISAVSEGVTGTAQISVVTAQTPVATVSVSPSEASVEIGRTVAITATLRDAQNNLITGRPVQWSSTDGSIASVSQSGVVIGVTAGRTSIIAQAEGKGTSAIVTVTRVAPLVTGSPRAGASTSCLLRDNGQAASTAWCWGKGEQGQRGDGSTVPAISTPVLIGSGFRDLALGLSHGCAVTASGSASCWGSNGSGQASGGGSGFARIAVGNLHSCALDGGGAAWCWGAAVSTGDANMSGSTRTTPVPVANAPAFVDIATGFSNTCAITAAGAAWCWGITSEGASGLGGANFAGSQDARAVVGASGFSSISGRDGHYCALAGTSAYCWGRNTHGQLGDGSTTNRNVPVRVQTSIPFKAVEAGGNLSCGLATDGKAWCWGQGGALGDNTSSSGSISTPIAVAGDRVFTEISVGADHACARASDGTWCWGFGGSGEQGNGDPINGVYRSFLPTKVIFPQ